MPRFFITKIGNKSSSDAENSTFCQRGNKKLLMQKIVNAKNEFNLNEVFFCPEPEVPLLRYNTENCLLMGCGARQAVRINSGVS